MVLSGSDIKKQIIHSVLDFSISIDVHKKTGEYSLVQISEMLSLAIEINNLINFLDKDPTKMQVNPGIKKPSLAAGELSKMKRALELTFKYNSDLNSVAIDIGENLSSTNRHIQKGVDYIFENLSRKDYKQNLTQSFREQAINPNPTQAQARQRTNTARQQQQRAQTKKKSAVGPFSALLFMAILFCIAMFIYNVFFNQHATRVSSLVKEYRSDQNLSSIDRPDSTTELKVYGTKSLLNIFIDFQDTFEAKYPGLKYNIKSEDSGLAIRDLIDGKIALASSSKMPSIDDRKRAAKENRSLADHKIALDSVVFFTHKSNPIDTLSLDDLRKIYASDSINWNEVNQEGSTEEISRFSLSRESGTHAFFKDRVMLGEDLSDKVVFTYVPDQMIDMVKSNPNAIGFCSVSAIMGRKDIKIIKIASVLDKTGTKPIEDDGKINAELVKRGDYPLTRYLYLITAGELTDGQAKFIDFMRSPDAQSKLLDYGLVGIY